MGRTHRLQKSMPAPDPLAKGQCLSSASFLCPEPFVVARQTFSTSQTEHGPSWETGARLNLVDKNKRVTLENSFDVYLLAITICSPVQWWDTTLYEKLCLCTNFTTINIPLKLAHVVKKIIAAYHSLYAVPSINIDTSGSEEFNVCKNKIIIAGAYSQTENCRNGSPDTKSSSSHGYLRPPEINPIENLRRGERRECRREHLVSVCSEIESWKLGLF